MKTSPVRPTIAPILSQTQVVTISIPAQSKPATTTTSESTFTNQEPNSSGDTITTNSTEAELKERFPSNLQRPRDLNETNTAIEQERYGTIIIKRLSFILGREIVVLLYPNIHLS